MRALLLFALLANAACVTPSRIQRAGSRVELGMAYYREGNLEGAIQSLREAHKLDPRNWRALNSLAVTYIAKGDVVLAEETFRKALRMNPAEAEILVNWGAFLVKTGRTDEAIAALQGALADLDYRNPAMVESNLAYAYLQAGRKDEALAAARSAVRRTPGLCEAWFHLGLVQEARQDDLGALDAYTKLVETCPTESIGGRLRQGCVQLRVGMGEEGAAALRSVMAEAPGTTFADQARACLQGG